MIVTLKNSVIVVSILFSILVSACSNDDATLNQVDPVSEMPTEEEQVTIAIANYVDSLTLDQKIAQLFLVSVDGTSSNLSATKYPVPPGGYVLFSRNTADGAEKIITLIGDTISHYAQNGEMLPYFSIDHEGGIVNRLRGVASPLPSAQQVAKLLDANTAEELYAYSAMQLKALGIHVNLGPMAEAGYKSNREFAGTRTYGNRDTTVIYSTAFLNGFRDNGIYCVVKHFPGNTNDDPHYFLPNLKGDKNTILSLYVDPFSRLTLQDGLLMSHVIVPSFDENNPACLSPTLIQDLVKDTLGFNGLIFSDDILMNALQENGYPTDIAISMALKAGVNVLMISHPAYWNIIPIVKQLVETDSTIIQYIDSSVIKIIEAKIAMGLYRTENSDNSGTSIVLKPTEINELYNFSTQLSDFYEAKELGDTLYNDYW